MPTEAPLSKDHPMLVAWNKYKDTDDYENIRRWVCHPGHTDGSMWACFLAGWNANMKAINEAIKELQEE